MRIELTTPTLSGWCTTAVLQPETNSSLDWTRTSTTFRSPEPKSGVYTISPRGQLLTSTPGGNRTHHALRRRFKRPLLHLGESRACYQVPIRPTQDNVIFWPFLTVTSSIVTSWVGHNPLWQISLLQLTLAAINPKHLIPIFNRHHYTPLLLRSKSLAFRLYQNKSRRIN